MNIRIAGRAAIAAFAFSTSLLGSLPARAEVPAAAKAEIDHLLTYVGNSGCEFYRNGSWYDGKKGQSHLSDKFNYLIGNNMIQTASDFIEKAATQSSMSGLAYKVRCNGAVVESAKWLGDELARFRGAASKTGTIASWPVTMTNVSATGATASPLPAKATVKVN